MGHLPFQLPRAPLMYPTPRKKHTFKVTWRYKLQKSYQRLCPLNQMFLNDRKALSVGKGSDRSDLIEF